MELIIDIETSDLKGTKLWLIVCRDTASDQTWKFEYPSGVVEDCSGFLDLMARAQKLIGHNIIGFDWPTLLKHFPDLCKDGVPPVELLDTLVLSRMLKFDQDGGHSLEAWGQRLGKPKSDFDQFEHPHPVWQEMVDYCHQDVEVTYELWKFFARFHQSPNWAEAIVNEHNAARIAYDLNVEGFGFNAGRARELRAELAELLKNLDAEIKTGFPPKAELIREITPRETKHGTLNATDFRWLRAEDGSLDLSSYSAGAPFSRIEWVEFNPASPKQMVERLNEAGWKPYEKTKTHIETERARPQDKTKLAHFREYGWKVSEGNLSTLPVSAPEAAHKLAQRLTVASRLSDLDEWLAEYNEQTGAIHGQFMHIGSWTHRMAHRKPNTGNIASVPGKKKNPTPVDLIKVQYDSQLRGLWQVRHPDYWQIGVDMESAHLRILAHLLGDDDYIKAVTSGSKEDGTDPHTMNKKALGDLCENREDAKTFIYTFINGGTAPKVSNILGCTTPQAKEAINLFVKRTPGLQQLLEEEIPRNARRGYFVGIDGRLVPYSEEHGQLAGILQNAEAIILKRAAWEGRRKLRADGVPVYLLNLVHDEIQAELRKDDQELAWHVGRTFANEYKLAAEHYELRCPFAGGIHVGKNWLDCH